MAGCAPTGAAVGENPARSIPPWASPSELHRFPSVAAGGGNYAGWLPLPPRVVQERLALDSKDISGVALLLHV